MAGIKRKQTDDASRTANKRQALATPLDAQDQTLLSETSSTMPNSTVQDQPFRLMDLPAELRNSVYEKALEEYPVAHLSRSGKKKTLQSDCPLLAVSKQVAREFRSVLELNAPIIETLVRQFNFGHIITFLNRLPDSDVEKITKDTAASRRTMRIKLFFEWSDMATTSGDDAQLGRWLRRIDQADEKGAGVEFQYVLEHEVVGHKALYGDRWLGERGKAEMGKIRKAGNGHFL